MSGMTDSRNVVKLKPLGSGFLPIMLGSTFSGANGKGEMYINPCTVYRRQDKGLSRVAHNHRETGSTPVSAPSQWENDHHEDGLGEQANP